MSWGNKNSYRPTEGILFVFLVTVELTVNLFKVNLFLIVALNVLLVILFIRVVYVNHRPAFGLEPEQVRWAFDVLESALNSQQGIHRSDLLHLLQTRGNLISSTTYVTLLLFIY